MDDLRLHGLLVIGLAALAAWLLLWLALDGLGWLWRCRSRAARQRARLRAALAQCQAGADAWRPAVED